MAIRKMTGKEESGLPNVESVYDYHGAEANHIAHEWECQHRVESYQTTENACKKWDDCLEGCKERGPLYMKTTHVGLVLELREHNGYDDSDFFARVWNPETGAPEEIMYATTRGWTYPNGAQVDATPEVLAAFTEWQRKEAESFAKLTAEREAKIPSKGRIVKVVKGRKVKIGTVGEVFWYDKTQYGYSVGMVVEGVGKVFTAAKNVEVIREVE